MLKKIFSFTTAFVLGLAAIGCSSKGDDDSVKKVSYDSEFKTADSFFLPTTPPMCEYTYKIMSADVERINDLTEAAFGSGSYGRGKLLDSNIQIIDDDRRKSYDWYNEAEQISSHLDGLGSFSFFKGKYSSRYNEDEEAEITLSKTVYAEDFSATVPLDGKTDYSTLTLDAQEKLYDCLEAVGSSIEVTPICAREYSDESGRVVYVCLDYSAKFGTGVMTTEAFADTKAGSFSGSMASLAYPKISAYYYVTDDIQGIWVQNMLFEDVRQGETISSPMEAEAAMKAIEQAVDGRPSDYTLCHCRLEYRPVDERDGIITAQPYWAFYCTDKDDERMIIAINVKTGEMVSHKLS